MSPDQWNAPGLRTSEKEFQQMIVDLATYLGYLHYHTHDSRRSVPGFPDLVLIRPVREDRSARLLISELKVGKNTPTPAQRLWLSAFAACGIETYVWYPRDWDEIVEVLKRA
jgi:hypothetical protein